MHWGLRLFLSVVAVFFTASCAFGLAEMAMVRHGIAIDYTIHPLIGALIDLICASIALVALTSKDDA